MFTDTTHCVIREHSYITNCFFSSSKYSNDSKPGVTKLSYAVIRARCLDVSI